MDMNDIDLLTDNVVNGATTADRSRTILDYCGKCEKQVQFFYVGEIVNPLRRKVIEQYNCPECDSTISRSRRT